MNNPEKTFADDVLARLGRRVYEERQRRAWPRKTLAAHAGISLRYLAQLENGQGNASIALLSKVATALNLSLSDLFVTRSHAELVARIERAAPDVKIQIDALLEHGDERGQRVALIGLRGAGKSTLGQLASRTLGVQFVELGDEISSNAGMSVSEVIALYGQEGYRTLEARALSQVVEQPGPLILAVAGGIVSEPATFEMLKRACHTIWLKATPEEHMARVRAQGDMRPMKGNPEALGELRSILDTRSARYREAEASLDTSGKTVDEAAAELVTLMRRTFSRSPMQS